MRTPETDLHTWTVGVECPVATAAAWLATIQHELEAQGVATISTAQTPPNQGYVCASVIYRAPSAVPTPSAALLVAAFTAH